MRASELKPRIGELVKITWLDAEGSSGWHDTEELLARKLPTIVSVGWLVGVTPKAVHTAADRQAVPTTAWNQCGLIPLGWIERVETLQTSE